MIMFHFQTSKGLKHWWCWNFHKERHCEIYEKTELKLSPSDRLKVEGLWLELTDSCNLKDHFKVKKESKIWKPKNQVFCD